MSAPIQAAAKKQLARVFVELPGCRDILLSSPRSAPENAISTKNPPTFDKSQDESPSVVLIFGWMGAQLPHLFKYTEAYHKLYPEAHQVIIRSHFSDFARRRASLIKTYLPHLQELQKYGVVASTHPSKLLVHAFSNGGCVAMQALYEAITQSKLAPKATPALPARAMIFDSAPGSADPTQWAIAFSLAFSGKTSRAVARIVLQSIFTAIHSALSIFGKADLLSQMRESLLSPNNLPSESPRTFIYSKEDQVISYRVIHEHANAIRERLRGEVEEVVFENTTHVNHLKGDPQRYWDAVKRTWDKSKLQRRDID